MYKGRTENRKQGGSETAIRRTSNYQKGGNETEKEMEMYTGGMHEGRELHRNA